MRHKLAMACMTLTLVVGFAASSAQAAEVFQPRAWVGPYQEGKHSAEGLVDQIQGEGWEAESCVDMHTESGKYTEASCAPAGHSEFQEPRNNGYARVWNAKGVNNEIWGWAYF